MKVKRRKENNRTYYVVFEETAINFFWDPLEVIEFDELWREGKSLKSIAKHFNRTINETALLLMDRSIQGKVKPRKYGLNDH